MSTITTNALIARGIDTGLAKNLSASGYTLQKLKQITSNELLALGLTAEQANLILSEPRPPIPTEIVNQLLYRNKRTCCICRDSEKPVVIHHIIEWHLSRNHDESNLAVLCLAHHDEAHSQKKLSQNLNEKELRTAKINWERDAAAIDIQNIFSLGADLDKT